MAARDEPNKALEAVVNDESQSAQMRAEAQLLLELEEERRRNSGGSC